MKKIMFNDKYGLTGAVLSGRKTQTRRIITCPKTCHGIDVYGFHIGRRVSDGLITEICMYDADESSIDDGEILPKYKIGEIIAIAKSYKTLFEEDCKRIDRGMAMNNISIKNPTETAGWTNKMFVRADLMPHQIRITNVRIERLQEISYEDCLREGVGISCTENNVGYPFKVPFEYFIGEDKPGCRYSTPQEAYAALIDKVSSKDTWESNPFVFVYDFELVR